MFLRAWGFVLVAAATFLVSVPVKAQTLKADEARKFVAGKYFSFNCFEGTARRRPHHERRFGRGLDPARRLRPHPLRAASAEHAASQRPKRFAPR